MRHNKKLLHRLLFAATCLFSGLLLAQAVIPAVAQETGFHETFDDASLAGWERSQDVTVESGFLRIYPGNLALKPGDWQDFTLQIRLRASQPGETVIRYYFHDQSHYTLILLADMVVLERFQDGASTNLGESPAQDLYSGSWVDLTLLVQGGSHSVQINGQAVFQASDPTPLPGGALLLQRFGEGPVEFDSVSLAGQTAAREPPQGELPAGEAPAGEAPAGEAPAGEAPAGKTPAEEPPPPEDRPPDAAPAGQAAAPPAQVPTPQPQDTASLIQEFFLSQASQIELTTFAINLMLSVVAAFVLGRVYIHWGASLSNRRAFAANFMLMAVTTTFIIMVVRSSVALSLGLVGALSIVRFRAAVKEPEELAYLFLAIGIGIGLGDNQRLLTLVTMLIAILVLGLMRLLRSSKDDANLHLTVASRGQDKLSLPQVMSALERHTRKLKLIRLDENSDVMEASFLVEFRQLEQLNQVTADLRSLASSVEISYLDNKGIW